MSDGMFLKIYILVEICSKTFDNEELPDSGLLKSLAAVPLQRGCMFECYPDYCIADRDNIHNTYICEGLSGVLQNW